MNVKLRLFAGTVTTSTDVKALVTGMGTPADTLTIYKVASLYHGISDTDFCMEIKGEVFQIIVQKVAGAPGLTNVASFGEWAEMLVSATIRLV